MMFQQLNNSSNIPLGIPCFFIHPNHFIGSSVFGPMPAFVGFGFNPTQTSPLGSNTQQSQPAFGTSILCFSTPFGAFGSSTPFGASSLQAFGSTGTPAFGASSGNVFGLSNMSAFGPQIPTPAFGSRVASYSATTEIDSGNTRPGRLESISAMPVYKDKSHEELRWVDYQLGDKGSLAFGPFGSATRPSQPAFGSNTQQSQPAFGSSIFGSSTHFGASSQPPFGSTGTPAFGVTSTPAIGVTSTHAFGSTGTPAFGSTGTPAFGATSTPAFGVTSTPAFGATSTPAFGATSRIPAFGATSTPAFCSTGTPSFGATNTPAFGSTSPPAFGATNTPAFGSTSPPAFGATSTPAFGATSTPTFGLTSTPAFGNTGGAFGMSSTPVFGGGGAFGASSSPVFGSSSTSAFGASSSPAFGASSSPAFSFGSSTQALGQSSSAFGSSSLFGCTTSAFGGSQTPTPAFGSTGMGQSGFGGQQGRSRVASYSATTEIDSDTTPPRKLESVSAMPVYEDKSHEELRWVDYQLGDKGGPLASAPQSTRIAGFSSYTSQTNAFSRSPVFGQSSANPFSSATPNSNPFALKTSTFSSGFGTSAPAFSSSAFGSSTSAAAPSIFYSSSPPSDANFTSQAFGLPQPSQLFSSASPSNLHSSSVYGQNTSPFEQTAEFSQSSLPSSPSSELVGSIFSSSTSLTSNANTDFGQTAPLMRAPLQSSQPAQSSGTFSFNNFGQTQPVCASSFIGTPDMFGQNNFEFQAIPQSSTVVQAAPVTNSLGTTPSVQDGKSSMPVNNVQDNPATLRQKNFQIRTYKNRESKPGFGGEEGGSRVASYSATTEENGGTCAQAAKLVSISAMSVHENKSHEELRWEEYPLEVKMGGLSIGS